MFLNKKEDIKKWLDNNLIKKYKIIKNKKYGYVVNVNDNVDLKSKKLKTLDVKFNKIEGNFNCSYNKLESLEGSPEIVNGTFNCSNNKLRNLNFSPKQTTIYFCNNNQLETLEGLSDLISLLLQFNNNKLTIEGLKFLNKKQNIIYISFNKNIKLGNLQKITNFKEFIESYEILLNIKDEKENLLNIMNKENLMNDKNVNKI